MFRRILLGVLAGLFLSGRSYAQVESSADSPPLTLNAAVAEAIEQHPALRAARAQYEAARSAPAQERFLSAPMLEAQIWAWPITTLNPVRTDMYMFMAEQELPGKGKRAARATVAERDAELTRQQIPLQAVELVSEVRQAFVELDVARRARTLFAPQRELLRDMTEATTLRYASSSGVGQ